MDLLVLAVQRLLGSSGVYALRLRAIAALSAQPNQFSVYFKRFMLAFGIISFDRMFRTAIGYGPRLLPLPKICLTMPETPSRRERFAAEHSDFELFDGLRCLPAWRGCGFSYKFLANHLQRSSVKNAIICEDDAVFSPITDARLAVILEYPENMEGRWDVFCGMIANLHEQTIVSEVHSFNGETFVWLDKAVSTVFNIYSRRAIECLARWDANNGDPETNTIDRHMERSNLRFVTTSPFLVEHDQDLNQSLQLSRRRTFR